MRPSLLDPLFAPAQTLPGVGSRIAALIARAVGAEGEEPIVRDLLFHLPAGAIDRRRRPPLYEMPPSGIVTVEGIVERIEKPRGLDGPWRIVLAEGNAAIQIVYFRAQSDWLKKLYPIGERRIVSGQVEWFDMRPQIRHPDYVLDPEHAGALPAVEPVYRLTAELSPKVLRRAVAGALERLPELPEWLSPDLVAARGWPGFADALREVHRPASVEGSGPSGPAWQRLAFDELVASQLALALVRGSLQARARHAVAGRGTAAAAHRRRPALQPDASQRQALAEIERDLAGDDRMLRLLQGDVGSGKTIVALIAMATIAEAGGQAALMAPTELLARQHFATIAPLAAAAGIEAVLLTGKDRAAERAGGARPHRFGKRQHRRRHACAVPGRRRVPAARPRRGRRAASLRRASAAGALGQGRGAGRAGDDGDADPAHAGPLLFRRHGRVAAHRKAGRSAADRHARGAARPARRGGGAHRPGDRCGRQGLLGVPAGGGIGEDRRRRRRGALRRAAKRPSASASGWCMAA